MSEPAPGERLRRVMAPPLIIFVLVSIGFALGRLSAGRESDAEQIAPQDERVVQPRVLVRYFHGDVRCVTCTTIEGMLRACLDARYAEAQAAGDLVFSEINFDRDETLAARYDISSSIPLLAYEIDGIEAGAHQLEAVWELKDDREIFEDYLIEEIDAALAAAGLARWKAAQP